MVTTNSSLFYFQFVITIIATTVVLVNTFQFSQEELSAIDELKSEGFSDADIETLLKEFDDQDLDYDHLSPVEDPSPRGGPSRRRRPGSSKRGQTLFQFLMKRLSRRRKPRPRPKYRPRPSYGAPRPRPQYGPPRKRRPSYQKPRPSYQQINGISQVPVQPFDELEAPTSQQTYQEEGESTVYISSTTESPVATSVIPPLYESSSASYDTSYTTSTLSPSPSPAPYEEPERGHNPPSSPSTSYQEPNGKFSFPPFPFSSLDRDTFFQDFKSKLTLDQF